MENIFKKIIVLYPMLIILYIVLGLVYPIDNEILKIVESDDGIIFNGALFFDIITILVILSFIASLILLYKFYNIGRILFIFSYIFLLIVSIDLGYQGFSPNEYIIDYICGGLDGVLLFLMYFSPLKEKFK